MARSPLFSLIRRAAAQAHLARRSGIHPSRFDPVASGPRLDRRRFLEASAGVSAMGVLAACGEDPAPTQDAPRVVIVGAGLAGLHCAYQLRQAGVPSTVFEALNRVGGRTFTARDMFPNGQVAELGGEFINTEHATMLALATELGLQLTDRQANEPAGYTRERYFFDGEPVDEADIVQRFTPLTTVMAETVDNAEVDDELFETVDAMSISEWLSMQNADPLIQEILEVAYTIEYGLDAQEQSIFNLLYLIDYDEPDPFRITGSSDERYHLSGGSDGICLALRDILSDDIQLERALTKISRQPDGRYVLEFTQGATETADHVVLTLPFTALRDVDLTEAGISAEKQEIIDELGYGTNTKLMGAFTERVWRAQYNTSGSAYTDNGLQFMWDTSIGQPGDTGLLTTFQGGTIGLNAGQGTAEERMAANLPLIDEVFPGAQAAYMDQTAVRMHWPSADFFKGSYACYRTGQWAYYELEGIRSNNLHFAGEHTSPDYQGYMEGGAETGAFAAREVLTDLGIPLTQGLTRALGSKLRVSNAWTPGHRRMRCQTRRNLNRRMR